MATYITKKITHPQLTKEERIKIAINNYEKGYTDLLTCLKLDYITQEQLKDSIKVLNKSAENKALDNVTVITKKENKDNDTVVSDLISSLIAE